MQNNKVRSVIRYSLFAIRYSLFSIHYSLFSILFVLCACEQTVDVELPYDKKIVINSFVGRSLFDDHAWISRTLPYGETVTNQRSAILNANVQIHWRDTTYTLVPVQSQFGFQLPPADKRWQGDSLKMTVDWDGLHAEATAKVPLEPIIHSVTWRRTRFDSTFGNLYADISIPTGTVAWTGYSNHPFPSALSPMEFYDRFFYAIPSSSDSSFSRLTINIGGSPRDSIENSDTVEFLGWVSDIEYERYLLEPYASDDGPFGFGGRNPYFNVKGNGIGLFVPLVEVRKKVKVTIEKD